MRTLPAELGDRGAYFPGADALVVADLHVGHAAASDVAFPVGEHEALRDRLGGLLDRFDPAAVVVAGDALHAFDGVPNRAARTFSALVEDARDAGAEVVVTPGNHDAMLASVFDGPTPAVHRLDDWAVAHGHEAPSTRAAGYVVGHDHPAIRVQGRKHPCFLYGPGAHDGAAVLVLPAFSPLAAGSAVGRRRGADLDSPLVTDLDRFHPVVWDADEREALAFPALADLREHL